ncbi:myosin heavy chain, striated muscle [Melanotaenia boesemani]|uniref:myosin heavy chain, striated muscle n=1 Tax=Melanotaenia boesemani TaxID=1250792 RepID=UPI001C04F6FF|nr:myosin heavy chain, striated muscle [Melanotaenia boesemani]
MTVNKQMAGGSHFIWVPLLLSCVLHTSDNRNVPDHEGETVLGDFISKTGNPELDQILSKIPITLPGGTDFTNVSITSVNVRLCTGLKEELASLKTKFQQATRRSNHLDEVAFGLRREVRELQMRLATCSSTASAVAGSYEAQLLTKMNQQLELLTETEISEMLKILMLTREVSGLQKKVGLATNSTESTDITDLQKKLKQKTDELLVKKQEIEKKHASATLILQIMSLQSQIWDLQQEASNKESVLQPDKRILGLQEQLDRKIGELQGKGEAVSAVLELISVRSKITVLEKMISIYIEKSRTSTADGQRQWRQKVELLKKKILQLNRDENNKELTREILKLQGEVDGLANLIMTTRQTLEASLTEIRVNLETERKRVEALQRQLEAANYALAQPIMKIISIMEELRQQQHTTSTGQSQDILVLLQTYKTNFAKAQTEITDLQERLRQTREECSSLEDRHTYTKTELEKKIAELSRTDNVKGALILSILNLAGEIKALKEQISTSDDKDLILNLQKQLQKKQEELNSKTAETQKLTANPQIILTITELQNNIWDLQNKFNNGTTDEINALQKKLDSQIDKLDSTVQDNIKQMLKIITLQSQVKYLQDLLSNQELLQTTRVTELTDELKAKESDLKQFVDKLNEKNQTNAKLILTITDLQTQLRKIEREKETEGKTSSATVSKLQEQLKIKEKENIRNQALIKSLQNSLNQTETQCSAYEQKIKDLEDNIDAKIEELTTKSDTVISLGLQISTLTGQLEELKKQLQNSVSKSKADALQKIIDEKTKEVKKKTDELKERSSQAQRILQILAIQVEIEKLVNVPANETDYTKIEALQYQLNNLIDGIQDKDNENTKLTLQILTQQDEIARLKKQEENQLKEEAQKIRDLEAELENIRNQIKLKTNLLGTSDRRISNLSAQIVELHNKIPELEDEITMLKQSYAENLAELKGKLTVTKGQLEDSQLRLKTQDAENFKLITDILDLKAQLKKTQQDAAKRRAKENNISDLEEMLQTQQKKNKKLENTNTDLKQQVQDLETCCSVNTQCEDLQRQLHQSQEDADRLHHQLREKDAALKRVQQQLEEQSQEKNKLQENYNNLLRKQGDVEDKTIFATKMTMDPNTAHPRIVLSEDKTEVSTNEFMLQVPELPGRFDVVLGVMGERGFSHGRHYWEVSVAGKTCYHIGMISESAPRKGSLSFKPANGYWSIILNKLGQLKALNIRPVGIDVALHPLTLGILLDYKVGEISFYDAGSRSHLYTFSGQTFKDKIYPFINYCVEDTEFPSPIVLVSPGSTNWIS